MPTISSPLTPAKQAKPKKVGITPGRHNHAPVAAGCLAPLAQDDVCGMQASRTAGQSVPRRHEKTQALSALARRSRSLRNSSSALTVLSCSGSSRACAVELALAHPQHALLEIDVLAVKRDRFTDAHPGNGEQPD